MNRSAQNTLDSSKPLPHSIVAEQALIKSILLDNQALESVADIVSTNDFYQHDHQVIFKHVVKLIEKNTPANITTLTSSLENSAELNAVGGTAYLTILMESPASKDGLCSYAKMVHEYAVKRKLIKHFTKITEKSYAHHYCDIQQLIDEAQAHLFALADDVKRSSEHFVNLKTLLPQLADNIDQRYTFEHKPTISGIATGFTDLDAITSGLHGGDLIVVAGRPATGKTAFSLNIAQNVALDTGLPVAIFSMETASTPLAMRMLISAGSLNQQHIATGRLEDNDCQGLTSAIAKLNGAPIFIDDGTNLNISDLRARAHRVHRQCGKLGLIIIDSLQSISASAGRKSHHKAAATAEILRSLKALAKDLDVPVIVTSKIKSSVEKRSDKHPLLSDLRKSGVIERNADVVLFIYRDELYHPSSIDNSSAEITIAKNPRGQLNSVRLALTALINIKHLQYLTTRLSL